MESAPYKFFRHHQVGRFLAVAGSPFMICHYLVLGALWTGARPIDWAVCLALYAVRMFGVTAGYHRYFSHRTYETSRVFRFVLALLATSTAQRGVSWWAAHHRAHHKHSDDALDVHSPRHKGFWYSHCGWLFWADEPDYRLVRDLTREPELRWLDRLWWAPPVALGVAVFAWLGASGLFIGFFLSTVLTWHVTFTINSLSHVWGKAPYASGDDSRNNWLLALLTFGEGWHNNHHHYQSSTRQGFHWYQLDLTYLVLRVLAALGIVWALREPPAAIVARTKVNVARGRLAAAPRAVEPSGVGASELADQPARAA